MQPTPLLQMTLKPTSQIPLPQVLSFRWTTLQMSAKEQAIWRRNCKNLDWTHLACLCIKPLCSKRKARNDKRSLCSIMFYYELSICKFQILLILNVNPLKLHNICIAVKDKHIEPFVSLSYSLLVCIPIINECLP